MCVPNCTGKLCGDDGCGGECGACPDGQRLREDGSGCTCTPDCGGTQCGDDGCGGSCGGCGTQGVCTEDGSCLCVPDCDGKVCGDDGCGGSCGSCPEGHACAGRRRALRVHAELQGPRVRRRRLRRIVRRVPGPARCDGDAAAAC